MANRTSGGMRHTLRTYCGGESGSFYLLHRDWVSGVRNLAVCTDVARIR